MEAARESMAALLDAGLFGPAQTLVRVLRSLPSLPPILPALESLGFRGSPGASGAGLGLSPAACASGVWVAALGDGARFPSQQ